MMSEYSVIVIGAGHSGCEAALACSRMGVDVGVITASRRTIGVMPCNPSIGGPAKSQIVSEIDALGGEMGRAADQTHLQMKVLNRSRGPAVQCLRSQNDKYAYQKHMQAALERAPHVQIIEGMACRILCDQNCVTGVQLHDGRRVLAQVVVVTTGTFLNACMHTGDVKTMGGRVGEDASEGLSDCLQSLGLTLGRFKTGTPPRLHADSLHYDALTVQHGDPEFLRFSLRTPFNTQYKEQQPCYLTTTTTEAHNVMMANLDRSPLYNRAIKGVGPRYCPSIEDKVVRFKDKASHHIFLEPESLSTPEIYAQGLNTSMPEDVQLAFLKTMPGLGAVEVLKYGYAVEYDYVIPTQLTDTLETRVIRQLFCAGQINGTSGYEEAAGQGIVAGINAALMVQKKEPFRLTREQSFIGTLIDDLITKTIEEPYRMLTSRSEYRLLLRQDNAMFRVSQLGYACGAVSQSDWERVGQLRDGVDAYKKAWKKEKIPYHVAKHYALPETVSLYEACKRPEVTMDQLFGYLKTTDYERYEQYKRTSVEIKYAGYLRRQQLDIDRMLKWQKKPLPATINYNQIPGLRNECRLRLVEKAPKTLYEAKKIGGVNPADIAVLITYLS